MLRNAIKLAAWFLNQYRLRFCPRSQLELDVITLEEFITEKAAPRFAKERAVPGTYFCRYAPRHLRPVDGLCLRCRTIRYLFGVGDGNDIIYERDTIAGNQDSLLFGSGIASNQLWFRQADGDLEISVIGTNDQIKVMNWFTTDAPFSFPVSSSLIVARDKPANSPRRSWLRPISDLWRFTT